MSGGNIESETEEKKAAVWRAMGQHSRQTRRQVLEQEGAALGLGTSRPLQQEGMCHGDRDRQRGCAGEQRPRGAAWVQAESRKDIKSQILLRVKLEAWWVLSQGVISYQAYFKRFVNLI